MVDVGNIHRTLVLDEEVREGVQGAYDKLGDLQSGESLLEWFRHLDAQRAAEIKGVLCPVSQSVSSIQLFVGAYHDGVNEGIHEYKHPDGW